MNKIKLFFKILKSRQIKFHDITGKSLDKIEQDCLALGLWEMFKLVNLPEYLIGLNKDAESLLDQYVFEKHPGLSQLDHVKKKIEILKDLLDNGLNIYKFFSREDFYHLKTQQ